jgi:hypothetical protein
MDRALKTKPLAAVLQAFSHSSTSTLQEGWIALLPLKSCARRCAAEIGIGLTGLGFLFLLLGVLFFFDKGLIALGNVSF